MKRLAYFIPILLLAACSEFFSPDIGSLLLDINSPKDSLYSKAEFVTFWWEDDRKAESYRLQLVTPDFDNPTLIFDTIIAGNVLEVGLDEGIYTWRLRAENESSESAYQQRVFILDRTPPATPDVISPLDSSLLSPSDADSLILRWESQDFPIDDETFAVTDSIYLYRLIGSSLIPVASYFNDLNEANQLNISADIENDNVTYVWEVVSLDQAGNRRVSEAFLFYFD